MRKAIIFVVGLLASPFIILLALMALYAVAGVELDQGFRVNVAGLSAAIGAMVWLGILTALSDGKDERPSPPAKRPTPPPPPPPSDKPRPD